MNKTLMLVICDFLLLSMLALARFDPPEVKPEPSLDATAASETAEAELVALLEESLESELSSRQNLTEDLTVTRQSLQEKARLLAEREAALEATQSELQSKSAQAEELAKTKAQIEAEQSSLAAEKARIEAERAELAERFDRTRSELEAAKTEQVELVSTLGQLKEESSLNREKMNRTEKELIAREIALAEREAALKDAEEAKARLVTEREALNRQLEVAQAERRLLEKNLTQEQAEKLDLQREKQEAFARADRLGENVSELGQGVSQLGQDVGQLGQDVGQLGQGVSQLSQGVGQIGQGVSTLTQTSQQIQKEIEAARPQTMSEIFTRFQNNRASLRFTATERGFLGGENVRSYESKSILIEDESGATYLVTHSANSPFAFNKNAGSLLAASLEVSLGNRRFPVNRVAFLSTDPRILFIPMPQGIVDASGLETFSLALQPERWEEAVLVKNDGSNFGRTGFRRLTESERFLKMDRPALGQLFADFASSRGDLAFTKSSQFIGLLTDSEHAVVVNDFLAAAVTQLGPSFDSEANASTMDRLRDRVQRLPNKVH